MRLALEDQRTLAAALLSEDTKAPSPFLKSCHPNTHTVWKADETTLPVAVCEDAARQLYL